MYIADESNYKLDDEFDSHEIRKKQKKPNNNKKIIVVILFAITIGLIVYFLSNFLLVKKTKANTKPATNNDVDTELSLKNKEVKKLYNYVSYNINNYNIFIRNPLVKYDNFSNYDKFYYISQFITEKDLKKSDNTNTYSLSNKKVKTYMKKFFGKKVKYEKNIIFPLSVNFTIENNNTGELTYDKTEKVYKVAFNSNISSSKNNYITKLNKAIKNKDNTITLEEKIIYYKIEEQDNKYNITLFKDYNNTLLIEKLEPIEKDMFEENKLLDEYIQKASTITYTFKKDNQKLYYFESSKLQTN